MSSRVFLQNILRTQEGTYSTLRFTGLNTPLIFKLCTKNFGAESLSIFSLKAVRPEMEHRTFGCAGKPQIQSIHHAVPLPSNIAINIVTVKFKYANFWVRIKKFSKWAKSVQARLFTYFILYIKKFVYSIRLKKWYTKDVCKYLSILFRL